MIRVPISVTHMQLELLAYLLEVKTEELTHLERLGSDNLRELTDAISARLFDEQAERFARISALAPLVPVELVVRIAPEVVPPLVAGSVAGALALAQPAKAVAVVERMKPGYLADSTPYLDPRAAAMLAPKIPARVLLPVSAELLRRGEYSVAGRFLEYSTPEQVTEYVTGISDDDAILRTAVFITEGSRLDAVVAAVPAARMHAIVASAATASTELQMVAITVLSRCAVDTQARYGTSFIDAITDQSLDILVRVTASDGDAAALLAIATHLDQPHLDRFASSSAFDDPNIDQHYRAAASTHEALQRFSTARQRSLTI